MDPLAHAAVAIMARPAFPKAPAWALLAATPVPDALFFTFQAMGFEQQGATRVEIGRGLVYLSPAHLTWSHGLLMCLVWSLLAAAIAFALSRDRRTAAGIGLLVFSHWLLDASVYNILPLALDGSPLVGLGLITTWPGFIAGSILEAGLIAGGIAAFWLARRKSKLLR